MKDKLKALGVWLWAHSRAWAVANGPKIKPWATAQGKKFGSWLGQKAVKRRKLIIFGLVAGFALMIFGNPVQYVVANYGPQKPNPEITQVVQDTVNDTQGGQNAMLNGFDGGAWVLDRDKYLDFASWLDAQQGEPDGSGVYVGLDNKKVDYDVIVNKTTGKEIAFYQTFTDRRSAACFFGDGSRVEISGRWGEITMTMWQKSLDSAYYVTPKTGGGYEATYAPQGKKPPRGKYWACYAQQT